MDRRLVTKYALAHVTMIEVNSFSYSSSSILIVQGGLLITLVLYAREIRIARQLPCLSGSSITRWKRWAKRPSYV